MAENDNYKSFIGYLDEQREIARLSKQDQKNIDSKKSDEAKGKLREIAYHALRKEAQKSPGSFDKLKDKSPNDLDDEALRDGLEAKLNEITENTGNIFREHFDEVLDGVPRESLEKLALSKEIGEKGDKKYAELLEHYSGYFQVNRIFEDYKAGKIKDPKILQAIGQRAAILVAKDIKEAMKKEGYSENHQKLAEKLALLFHRIDAIDRSYMEKGLEEDVKEKEEEYRKYEKEKGLSIADYVKDSLREYKATPETEDDQIAINLIYTAAKDKLEEE